MPVSAWTASSVVLTVTLLTFAAIGLDRAVRGGRTTLHWTVTTVQVEEEQEQQRQLSQQQVEQQQSPLVECPACSCGAEAGPGAAAARKVAAGVAEQASSGGGGGQLGPQPGGLGAPRPAAAAYTSQFIEVTDYRPALSDRELQRGIVSYGDTTRARRLLHKLLTGEAITAVYIGGSITWGQGASRQGVTDHAALTFSWLRSTFPHANHTLLNRAIPATPTSYMSLCLNWHVPSSADLVVLEYNINDGGSRGDEPLRRAHERLLRKLLSFPNAPAVIEVVVYRWASDEMPQFEIPYRYHGDDEIGVLAQYYHLPWVAMRSLMWDVVFTQPQDPRAKHPHFMADADHPNDLGHRLLSDMVIGYLRRVIEDLALHPWGEEDEQALRPPLPPPMLKNNWPSLQNSCVMGGLFKETVVAAKNFEWINEGTAAKEKWGWVGREPGAELAFVVNTAQAPAQGGGGGGTPTTNIGVVHLKSYEHMGRAQLSCHSGCSCQPHLLNGHHEARVSQVFFELWEVTRAERCEVRVRILPETDSGGHKVKVTGVVVSETPHPGDLNPAWVAAVDFGGDGSTAAYAG